jgi:hypothetical protein
MQKFDTIPMTMLRVAAVAAVLSSTSLADVTFSNPQTSLTVRGGAANNGLVPFDGYFRYTDVARNEETTWSVDPVFIAPTGAVSVLSNGLLSDPIDVGNNTARSTASVPGYNVSMDTQLVGRVALTTFNITPDSPTGSLDGAKYVFYTENDLFAAADAAEFTGSIANNNLRLFQFDTAQSDFYVQQNHVAATGAELVAFGCQNWTAFGTAIENGDLSVLSADGSNFVTSGDLGLVHAYDLSGSSASITVAYGVVAVIPEPAALSLLAASLALLSRRR